MKRIIIEITEELDAKVNKYETMHNLTYNRAIVELLTTGLLTLEQSGVLSDDWYGVCESCQ